MDGGGQQRKTGRLARLMAPGSVAMIGGKEAERAIRQCESLGFAGEIWPVNPNRTEIAGRPCYASVNDLPGIPDAAFVAVPRDRTIEAVQDLSAMGAGGAVCYASGFAETGTDGARHQSALVEAAGAMPLIGPNCYGIVNGLERLALWPDVHGLSPVTQGAAIITQSGNMGINFTMSRRALPLACLMSLGNQAQTTVSECMEALLDDPRIRAIGLHIEGIDDVARFSRAAIKALKRGVPIVALKTGSSEKGALATAGHTSTLAGADALYDALFERFRIARSTSVTAFLETLKLLCITGPLPGNRIASLSCSGGEASLMADRGEAHGIVFPDLKPDHAKAIRATLNEFVSVANPLDYHTFIWGNGEACEATFSALMSGGFDMTVLLLDFPTIADADTAEWHTTLDAFTAAARTHGARAGVIATLPECFDNAAAEKLAANGIAPMIGIDDTLEAIASAARIGAGPAKPPPAPLKPVNPLPGKARTFDEWQSKQMLNDHGLATPEGVCVAAAKAAGHAQKLGFPVALKAVGAEIAHKSDIGAVRLSLQNAKVVRDAARDLSRHSPALLVEKMALGGVAEVIIGIGRDVQFGPYLVIGAGGVLVELLKDSTILLLPATRAQIRKAVLGLRMAPLLKGYRGAPGADVKAVVDAAAAVADFALKHRDTIVEVDINPLIVFEEGKGAVAADALITMAQGEDP